PVAHYHTDLPSFPTRRSSDLSENEANSHYNALQVDLNSQIKDLQLRVLYTYSRTIDSSTGGSSGDLANVSNPYAGWRFDLGPVEDRKSTRLNSSHVAISYAVF